MTGAVCVCVAGIVAQTTVAVCNRRGSYTWNWYCGQQNVARSLFTSVLPPLLLMLWQSLVMPNVLYRLAWVCHPACIRPDTSLIRSRISLSSRLACGPLHLCVSSALCTVCIIMSKDKQHVLETLVICVDCCNQVFCCCMRSS